MASSKYTTEAPAREEKINQESFVLFGDNPEPFRQLVEAICQQLLAAEMTEHLGVVPYARSGVRRGYRNGYKPRSLKTRVGKLHPESFRDTRWVVYHAVIRPLPA